MIREEMEEAFDQYLDEDEGGEFGRIKNPRATRPDLCAFLILDALVPSEIVLSRYGGSDMVAASEHDQIWLDVDLDDSLSLFT